MGRSVGKEEGRGSRERKVGKGQLKLRVIYIIYIYLHIYERVSK